MIIILAILAYLAVGLAFNLAASRILNLQPDYDALGGLIATVMQAAVVTLWPVIVLSVAVCLWRHRRNMA